MDPSTLKPWLDLLVSPGVPVIITGLVLYLGIKYIPRLIESLITFILESPKHLQAISNNLIEITTYLRDVRKELRYLVSDVDQCKEGARHLANAVEITLKLPVLSDIVPEDSKVFDEVERMQRSLAIKPRIEQSDGDRRDRERERKPYDSL